MTFDDLVAEAALLSRRCVHLVAASSAVGRPVAVWGGEPRAAASGTTRHLLSVDLTRLPSIDTNGLATLGARVVTLLGRMGNGNASVVLDDAGSARILAGNDGGVALAALEATSLPPLDALFRFGSARVQDWLRSHGWLDATGVPDAYNANFPDAAPAASYEAYWQERHPLYAGGVHAIVGGWHFPWPDGDWAERLEDELLLWTLAEAEPWIELWRSAAGTLNVRERIT